MSITNLSLEAYSLISTKPDVVANSSSGGAFYEFAMQVISAGGVVGGATMDETGKLVLSIVRNAADLHKLMRSKYVQAEVGSVYKEIEVTLNAGVKVLFCSVPCYCNALCEYLGKDYDNLIDVDVICHGTPSPLLWDKYLKYKGFREIQKVNFRDKRNGWSKFGLSITGKETEYFCNRQDDPYMRLFLNNLSLRPSCYNCQSKGRHRRADITLGDYWGATEKEDKGISLCIINTEKGNKFFENVAQSMIIKKVDAGEALSHNTSFYQSVGLPLNRKKLYMDFTAGKDVFSSSEVYLKTSHLDKIMRGVRRISSKIGKNDTPGKPYVHEEIESLKYNCCGCGLCEQICPKGAICMQRDEEGFLYPKTDFGLCVNCGQCIKRCIKRNEIDTAK